MSQKIVHRKKFDKGRRTPQEYHKEFAFPPGAKCAACGHKPALRAVVLAPFDEAQKRNFLPEGAMFNPAVMQMLVQVNEGTVSAPSPKTYVRISVTYSCESCRVAFEKALARGPSWCIVDISRGPDPTNKILVGAG